MSLPLPEAKPRLLASYGRRCGRRLRSGRQQLLSDVLPRLQLTLEDVEMWRIGDVEKFFSFLFPHIPTSPYPPLFLEIGFGAGEHLVHQATNHPNVGFIGCEPYIDGVATLLRHIEEKKLSNIRIFNDDARLLLEQLPDVCLSRVFILYPDPWPKARHHKRRLISRETLDTLIRVMKSRAELRLATDHSDYCTWMFEQLLSHGKFRWQAQSCDDWLKPWIDWIPTRYEQKRLAGMPTYLNFTCS